MATATQTEVSLRTTDEPSMGATYNSSSTQDSNIMPTPYTVTSISTVQFSLDIYRIDKLCST